MASEAVSPEARGTAAVSARRSFPWGPAVGLALVAVVFLLVLGEVALRLGELPERLARQRTVEKGLYRLDDAAGYVMRPSFQGRLSTLEFDHPFRTNSRGLMGAEVGPKEPGEFRVVVLGDSFTAAGQMPEEQRFTEQLEQILRERGYASARVVNVAAGGWTTFNQSGYLAANRDWLQPDLVVIAFFVGNDLGENLLATVGGYRESDDNPNGIAWGRPAADLLRASNDWYAHNWAVGALVGPLPPPDASPASRERGPLPTPVPNTEPEPGPAPAPAAPAPAPALPGLGGIRQALQTGSRLYRWASEQWYVRQHGHRQAEPLNVGTWVAHTLREPPDRIWVERVYPLAESYLVRAGNAAAEDGVRLVLAVIPQVAQVDPSKLAALLELYQLRPDEIDLDLPQRELTLRAERHGIGVVDLLPAMRSQPDPGRFYFRRDEHFTVAGHRFAAEALADGLDRLGRLPAR